MDKTIKTEFFEWYKERLLILVLAFTYFITGVLSISLLSDGNIVTVGIFIPEGISLAFVLYFGKKIIPGIFLGQFILSSFYSHIGFIQAFEISIINSLEAFLALYLYERFSLSRSFKELRDVIGFVFIIIFALQPFSAIVSNVILFSQIEMPDSFIVSTFSWWFGNSMGQLVFTPAILLLFIHFKTINFKEYFLYGSLFGLFFYFFLIVVVVKNPFLLITLSVPPALFIVAKKGLLFGSFISVIVAIVASFSIFYKMGAFYLQSNFDNTVNYNLFVLAHITIIFIVGVLLEEKERYENSLKEKIEEEVNKNKEQQLLMLQQSRLAQMGEMISMIAHQWRQPLNNLALVNQLTIVKYHRGKLDEKAINYFKENSESQIELMSETIDNFRNFFKTETQEKECVLNDVITTTIELNTASFDILNIEIIFKTESEYKMSGYANALSQVLLNILNNAKDALVEKGVEYKKIWINLYSEDNEIVIEFIDNAGGIPEDIIDRVFDPYFSTKLEKNGTGLGLYMSKMIIQEQLHSSIIVSNTQDGAMFQIRLNKNKGRKEDKSSLL